MSPVYGLNVEWLGLKQLKRLEGKCLFGGVASDSSVRTKQLETTGLIFNYDYHIFYINH